MHIHAVRMTPSSSALSALFGHVAASGTRSYYAPVWASARQDCAAVHTCLDPEQAASSPLTSRAALEILATHSDANVRWEVLANHACDDALSARFLDDEEWLLRAQAIAWTPSIPLGRIVAALGDDSWEVRTSAGDVLRCRANELLSASPELVSKALESLAEVPLSEWKEWPVPVEVLFERAEPDRKSRILAYWCTSADRGVARRSRRLASRWVRTGGIVAGVRTRKRDAVRRADRHREIVVELVRCLAEDELTTEAHCHGLEAIGQLGR